MSTVVTLRLMVFSSASRYRSIKYSWQNRQAPFLRPSIVEAYNTKYRTINTCFGVPIMQQGHDIILSGVTVSCSYTYSIPLQPIVLIISALFQITLIQKLEVVIL